MAGERPTDQAVDRIDISGELDRHAAESLRLEILRLAKRHALTITNFHIEEAPGHS
jgi:hypothetical protein